MNIPAVSFVGWSGAGKTTFLEKLIPVLSGRGIRTAVIKRDGHDFQMDREGKDTWRFTQAGAACVAIANDAHWALLDSRPTEFSRLRALIHDVDLILAEGFTDEPLPKIEVRRGCADFRTPDPETLCAVITDLPCNLSCPVFGLEDIEAVADFLVKTFSIDVHCCTAYQELAAAGPDPKAAVSLTVDGKNVAMMPFVQDILRQVNLGLLSTLKGVELHPDAEICIRIRTDAAER